MLPKRLTQLNLLLMAAGVFLFTYHYVAQASSDVTTTVKISICGNSTKEGGEQCDNSDFGGQTCSDLGFSSGSLACDVSCSYNTASCTTSAEAAVTALFTASAGGSSTLANPNSDGTVEITLPTNFYSDDVRIQMFSYSDDYFESSKPVVTGKNFIGSTYDLVIIDESGNTITHLNQPATIVLSYTDADVSGMDVSTLVPYRWGSSDSSWQLISGSTNNTTAHTVTFSISSFSSFALFAAPLQSQSTNTNTGGGGGGGGGSYNNPSTGSINFFGRAYPRSTITLLKDAQVAAITVAGDDANFQINLTGLTAGNYIFAVYGEDSRGSRSSLLTFPVGVVAGSAITISGIFIAPTIAVDKSEVKRGDNIVIFGQSAAASDITIQINSYQDLFFKTKADLSGAYLYNLDTANLDLGQHFTKSKAAVGGELSTFSHSISFTVGTKTVLSTPLSENQIGDSNNDGRVNLIDYSIMAYWFKRLSPPENVDLNQDGKINLVDFSILAFYWTG